MESEPEPVVDGTSAHPIYLAHDEALNLQLPFTSRSDALLAGAALKKPCIDEKLVRDFCGSGLAAEIRRRNRSFREEDVTLRKYEDLMLLIRKQRTNSMRSKRKISTTETPTSIPPVVVDLVLGHLGDLLKASKEDERLFGFWANGLDMANRPLCPFYEEQWEIRKLLSNMSCVHPSWCTWARRYLGRHMVQFTTLHVTVGKICRKLRNPVFGDWTQTFTIRNTISGLLEYSLLLKLCQFVAVNLRCLKLVCDIESEGMDVLLQVFGTLRRLDDLHISISMGKNSSVSGRPEKLAFFIERLSDTLSEKPSPLTTFRLAFYPQYMPTFSSEHAHSLHLAHLSKIPHLKAFRVQIREDSSHWVSNARLCPIQRLYWSRLCKEDPFILRAVGMEPSAYPFGREDVGMTNFEEYRWMISSPLQYLRIRLDMSIPMDTLLIRAMKKTSTLKGLDIFIDWANCPDAGPAFPFFDCVSPNLESVSINYSLTTNETLRKAKSLDFTPWIDAITEFIYLSSRSSSNLSKLRVSFYPVRNSQVATNPSSRPFFDVLRRKLKAIELEILQIVEERGSAISCKLSFEEHELLRVL